MKHDRKKIKQNGIEKRTTNTKEYTFNIINLTSVTRVQIIVFSILYFYFEVVFHGTGARYILFLLFDVQTMEEVCHKYI